jgi:toxin ParE1/3/4
MVGSRARRPRPLCSFLARSASGAARFVAAEIQAKTRILEEHPLIGRPIKGRPEFRELVLEVLNARYVFRYGYDGERLVMLRVFHGREQRD